MLKFSVDMLIEHECNKYWLGTLFTKKKKNTTDINAYYALSVVHVSINIYNIIKLISTKKECRNQD